MTYSPPLDSGYQGSRYVEDDLCLHVGDLGDAKNPGVYALKLSVPDSWSAVTDAWDKAFDAERPEWLRDAFEHNVVVYVGATHNVHERLQQHYDNNGQSTTLAQVFPVHSLWDVWWFDTAGEAFDHEHGIAIRLRNTYPGLYVHAR